MLSCLKRAASGRKYIYGPPLTTPSRGPILKFIYPLCVTRSMRATQVCPTFTTRQRRSAWASACVLALVCAFGWIAGTETASGSTASANYPAADTTFFLAHSDPLPAPKRGQSREPETGPSETDNLWEHFLAEVFPRPPKAPSYFHPMPPPLAAATAPAGQLLAAPRAPPARNP